MTEQPTPADLPVARIVPRRRVIWVWGVPLAAVVLVVAMLVQGVAQRGPLIDVSFVDGTGLEPGRTPVRYQGMTVGRVERVRLSPDLEHVVARIRLDPSAEGLARAGAAFWIVRADVGLQGVTGLDTLLSGPYIELAQGDGSRRRRFQGLERPPIASTAGLHVVLTAERVGPIGPGTGVTYRDVRVGTVDSVELAADSTGVEIGVRIHEPYTPIVRTGTRFWNTSGVGIDIGLLGGSIRAESLEAIISGGIALATPEGRALGEPARDGARFELAPEPRDAWLGWRPEIVLDAAIAEPKP